MQAIILAGGASSRFYPYSRFSHKSDVVILGKTILEHTLSSIKQSGISDVIIVVGPENNSQHYLDAKKLGLKMSFVTQSEALGMGDAILRAKDLIKDDFFVLNASHVDFHTVKKAIEKKKSSKDSLILLAKEEVDVTSYGVLNLEEEKVLGIVEKPAKGKEPSHLKVVGIYLFPEKFLSTLETHNNKHYSLESAITDYAKKETVEYILTSNDLVSLKYPWDLLKVKDHILNTTKSSRSSHVMIAKNVIIEDNVTLGDNVKIFEGAVIKGPCYIGENAVIGNNALVRKNTSIEKDCVIGANTEVSDCLFMEGSKIHSGYVGDSIIGRNCRLAAYFCTGNRRLDRGLISVKDKEGKHITQFTSLGVIMGDDVHTGVNVSTMPGVIIGNHSVIGPASTVFENIDESTLFYTKFDSVSQKRKE